MFIIDNNISKLIYLEFWNTFGYYLHETNTYWCAMCIYLYFKTYSSWFYIVNYLGKAKGGNYKKKIEYLPKLITLVLYT